MKCMHWESADRVGAVQGVLGVLRRFIRTFAGVRGVDESAKFNALRQAAPEAVLEISAQGTILYANPKTYEFFGHSPGDLLGRSIEVLIPERHRPAHHGHSAQLFASAESRKMGRNRSITGRRADGSEFPADISLTHVTLPSGPMVLCIVRDVTEQHLAEQRLMQINVELESKVAQLRRHAEAMRWLSEMGELLQSSATEAELLEIASYTLGHLWPTAIGGIYLLAEDRSVARRVTQWGEPTPLLAAELSADNCWALRRGRLQQTDSSSRVPRCAHLDDAIPGSALCLPLVADGKIKGVLHVCMPEVARAGNGRAESVSLLQALGNQIALSLANLQLRDALLVQSLIDPLTGLYNRRALERWFDRDIAAALRDARPLALLIIDVDHFKAFNDNYGHEAGDAALRAITACLRKALDATDIACRLGGEEFALLLPDRTATEAAALAESLRAEVGALVLRHGVRSLGRVSVSIGVALLGIHGRSREELVRAADKALYEAKRLGRDRVVMAAVDTGASGTYLRSVRSTTGGPGRQR